VSESYLKTHPLTIRGIRIGADGRMAPASSHGCNRDVCIAIDGIPLFVFSWETTAFGNVGCTFAQFQAGSLTKNGPTICPDSSSPGVYYDTSGPIGVFPNHQQACNVWRGVGGRPCETIHS
jgi:hypothetical protein